MDNNVELTFYDKKFLEDLSKIHLTDEDLMYTQTPQEVLETLQDPNRRMILIFCGKICAGYFVIHEKESALDIGFDDKALLLRSLAISPTEQGKGIASAAMKAMPSFIRPFYPHANKIVLLVNAKNVPAQKLYKTAGFSEHGARLHEIHGTQFIYCRDLPKEIL